MLKRVLCVVQWLEFVARVLFIPWTWWKRDYRYVNNAVKNSYTTQRFILLSTLFWKTKNFLVIDELARFSYSSMIFLNSTLQKGTQGYILQDWVVSNFGKKSKAKYKPCAILEGPNMCGMSSESSVMCVFYPLSYFLLKLLSTHSLNLFKIFWFLPL